MVSRIEVIPSEVRGYGNIVEAKSLSDFVPVESDLVYSENVYSLTAVSGVHISLTVSSSSINVGSSVTLTATVMDDDTPVTGETVSFYDGETLLGSDSTDSSGVATYTTSSLTVGSHTCTAVYGEKTSNLVNVTVNKIASTLSISVSSASISYGDSVTLSGTLSVGSGESVKVYQGNTLLDTVTTSTGGAYSKTVTGLGVGAYSFHTVYDGDSTHTEVSSSNVSVTVNKLASTITLSVPSTGTVGTSYSITGTLVPTSGSVKLYENGSLKDTLTVSSGSFSKAITQSNEGTYSYYAVFEGSSIYESVTSSTGSIVVSDVPTPSYDGVSLTSDKSILSYADSESATLTAQLLDGSSSASVSGVMVEFFKGSTSLGTATTNSNGVATKSYASAGSGDISLTAEVGSLVSEIYVIEDCLIYDTATSDKTSKYSTKNLNSFTFDTDHYIANRTLGKSPASTYYSPVYIDGLTLPTDYEITVDVLMTVHGNDVQNGFNISNTVLETYSNANEASIYKIGNSQGLYYRVNGSLTRYDVGTVISANVWHRFYMKVEGTTVVAKITNLSSSTVTLDKTQTLPNIQSWKKFNISVGGQSNAMWFKNLKVKTL